LKDPRCNRKRFAAWFLLLALCLQRTVGFVGSEVVIAVELGADMDFTEQAIAEKIKQQEGIDANIQVQEEGDLESLQSLGYLAPFIFSEEVDSAVCYFTVEYAPKTMLVNTSVEQGQSEPNLPSNASKSFSERLFSAFYFWENAFALEYQPIFNTTACSVPHYWDNSHISILSPPPKYRA
jgi:hypothetical protein